MRIAVLLTLILSLGCSACGKTVRTLAPVTETEALSYGQFYGKLQLANGGELAVNGGRLLGPWLCGGAVPSGPDFCIRRHEVAALVDEHYRPGAEVAFLIPMALVAAIWVGSEEMKARKRREADARDAELRRQGVLPPLPTVEQRRRGDARRALFACFNTPLPDRDDTNAGALAESVWSKREQCLGPAMAWFSTHGYADKARGLYFVHAARQRYELSVCRGRDPGLNAPMASLINAAAPDWMGEYRAVAADSNTYSFTMQECDGEGADPTVLRQMISSFPLTELPPREPVPAS